MSQTLPLAAQLAPTSALPDIANALTWRDWAAGLEEAQRRRAPMLGLVEPTWTNSAQRLALVFGKDEELRALLEEVFVPVRIDPFQRPDLAARWRWASIAIGGTSGPPLLLLLTHEGLPFLSYNSMWPEGRDPHPSLASLARATADAYARDPDAFVEEARDLEALATREVPPAYPSARELWQSLVAEADMTYGGMREIPKHPHPQLLWLLLELGEGGETPETNEFVLTTLRAMMRGGINDQLAEGFHRCSRDERWIVPHFEKPLPLNAQLAALYTRAARLFEDGEFLQVANTLVAFCLAGLRDGVDAVGSESHFYTWTSREMLTHLDPAHVQAISLHYNMTPDRSRQVLYRAIDPEAMDQYSLEEPEALWRRILAGRRQLRVARSLRPSPELIQSSTLSWPAETLRWLFNAAEGGGDVPVGELDNQLECLTADRFRAGLGYPRIDDDRGESDVWLEDQAALLAAFLAAHRVTRTAGWLEQARRLADIIVDQYGHERGWKDQPGREGDSRFSLAVTDEVLPATIATLTNALGNLDESLGRSCYADVARCGATHYLAAAGATGQWSAAFWRSWFQISSVGEGVGETAG
ncbi:MAG: DUF255 domain-containing protein [Chloroflexi bacterium]|nr:DUF255 domain-containing protein [Chloroflexota bacterium]